MANQTIVSLALLKVTWDKNRTGYLDTFLPMLIECLRLQADDIVSIPDLKKSMKEHFGLTMPHNVINTILKKARRKGYVHDKDGAVYRVYEKVNSTDFRTCQFDVVHSYEALVDSLTSYAKAHYRRNWDNKKAEDALFGYLGRNELISQRSAPGADTSPEPGPPAARQRGDDYIVAAFIHHLESSHSSQYTFLEMVVTGNMLKDALYLANVGQLDRKFKHTAVYLDTSFLIFALGYGGPIRREPCTELLELLYSVGADLRCFRHTYDEIFGILHACERVLCSGDVTAAYGPSMEYFIAQGYTNSDILLMKENLERDLNSIRVEVMETPPYDEHAFVIDETALTTELKERIPYHKEKSVEKDVASLAAITRLRQGRKTIRFEECRALFITTNGLLCSTAQQFLGREDGDNGYVPVCVTDHVITSLLWVKQPLKAPDLPRKRLIADCYAALQPSASLLQAFQTEVNRLEETGTCKPDDVFLLRHALEAKQVLMDVTLGNLDAFVEGTVPEILKQTKERLVQEERGKLTGEIAELTREKDAVEETRSAAKRKEAAEKAAIEGRANELAGKLVKIVLVVVLAVMVMATPLLTFKVSYLAGIFVFILNVVSIVCFVYGVSLKSFLRSKEVTIARIIKGLLIAQQVWRNKQ